MRTGLTIIVVMLASVATMGQSDCGGPPPSDRVQAQRTEQLAAEAASAVGMPAITNFREMRLLKDIYEMRDQDGLTTYTYTFSEMTGKLTPLCTSVGYGLPYSTQFINPDKVVKDYSGVFGTLPQAEPNGLFMPSSAEGTWIMCLDEQSKRTRPVYSEPRLVVSPFKLEP